MGESKSGDEVRELVVEYDGDEGERLRVGEVVAE